MSDICMWSHLFSATTTKMQAAFTTLELEGKLTDMQFCFQQPFTVKHDLPPWGFHLPWSPMCEGSKASFSLAPTSFSCPPGSPTPLFFLSICLFLVFSLFAGCPAFVSCKYAPACTLFSFFLDTDCFHSPVLSGQNYLLSEMSGACSVSNCAHRNH